MIDSLPGRRRRPQLILIILLTGASLVACKKDAAAPAPTPTSEAPSEWTSEAAAPDAATPAPPAAQPDSPAPKPSSAAKPPPVLAATGVNCVKQLRACGFPDASNTGWQPTGVKLTTAGVNLTSDKEFQINTPGAVIDGKDIQGCVSIKANNVTIK